MDIRSSLENIGSIWAAAVAAVVAGPLGVWAGEIDPPDPAGLAVKMAIPFCCICLFLVWIWGPALGRTARRLLASATLLLGLPALAFYLLTYFSVVVSQPVPTEDGTRNIRVTVGNEFRPGVEPGNLLPAELLMDYAFDPGKIWTPASIRYSQVKLNGLFILSFALLSTAMALIAVRPTTGKTLGGTEAPA
ncbi:hypothetical protein [Microbulbifer sediminum]|uniref:hypothetical protein n=1 Tax=Microbulbifer sediminum TaxID=2904250 RepID=UPI001F3D80EA|nr:hypothetical protein [Microbulbifer sediminum]